MITRFHVKGYRCLKDVDVALTPLHAIIGPNDTGKSSFLQALGEVVDALQGQQPTLPGDVGVSLGGTRPGNPLETFQISMNLATGQVSNLGIDAGGGTLGSVFRAAGRASPTAAAVREVVGRYAEAGAPAVALFRPVADSMRTESVPIADGAKLRLPSDASGWGGVLDTIRDRDPSAYDRIQRRVQDLFPTVASLRPFNTGQGRKLVGIRLLDNTEVRATEMSEGLLYFLAFATIGELAGPDGPLLWLVEEPENGLHPARIKEVVQILRAMSESGQQVVLATHSPLVVNELQPEEVTIFQRDPVTGTRATRMVDTIDFAERFKDYALGELWVSFLEEHMVRESVHPVAADGG